MFRMYWNTNLRFGLKIAKTTILTVSEIQFFFFVKKKVTGDYYDVAMVP